MTNAISGLISSQSAYEPQQVASPQPETKGTAPQHKDDVVTISAQGKKAIQQPAQYSPTEEMKESATQKAIEAQAGKK
jgi:hypothetical protein